MSTDPEEDFERIGEHPVAGGGRVVNYRRRRGDGRTTIDTFHYSPEGDFQGVTQADVTARPLTRESLDPEANIRAALNYIKKRYDKKGSWTSPWDF